ncbi:MAG: DNA translocase FtsK [Rhodobacteraceae bacterium]|nr:DNA translocase FtsK [Paracoccaceae bacterium]
MASYSARRRDPLFDSATQATLERRGKELLGFAFIAMGLAIAALLATYVPEDPSWLTATDAPAANMLGRFGASIASPLYIIAGMGSWGLALVLTVWGARFVLHVGEERAIGRLIFAPIAIAVASVYASTHVPTSAWTHSFGLGGLFGDTVLGAILGIVPLGTALGLKAMAFVMAIGAVAMALFVLGVNGRELRLGFRIMAAGIIMVYAGIAALVTRSLTGSVAVARNTAAKRAQRREAAIAAFEAEAAAKAAMPDAPVEKRSGMSGLFTALTRNKDAEEAEDEFEAYDDLEGDARISARIADVIRKRVGQEPSSAAAPARIVPPLVSRAASGEPSLGGALRAKDDPAVAGGGASGTISGLVPPAPSDDDLDAFVENFDDGFTPDPIEDVGGEATESRPMLAPLAELARKVQHPIRKAPKQSRQARAEAQPGLGFDEHGDEFETPPLSLLANPVTIERSQLSDEALEENARMLEVVLDDYGVKGEIVSVRPGPVVTMYELEPAPGLKASRVIGLADDIARSMSALSARVSTVPGRSVIGIELPNENREKVLLREILASRDFGDGTQKLPLALGKDIGGDPIVANLAKMPHLLIAGTTGSGKSVAINTMILSLLYKLTPAECRMIMIDPKMLELSVYDGIPHLLSPVVTDPKKAVVALKWVVGEMEERYRKMSKMGVRNIEGYNGRVADALAKDEMFSRTVQTGFDDDTGEPVFETEEFAPEKIPYIVVVVDEMADLMMVAGKEIEACIQRLAQMARASGIHLIMATQRPSVDVITGTIKANFPTRISFQVTGKIDSRTILGEQGAEQLLGMGDMLYMAGGAKITRVHGPFVSDEEVEEIVNHLKTFGPPEYMSGVVDGPSDDSESDIELVLGLGGNTDSEDAMYDTAVAIVLKDRKCSTSYIQRKLAIGYNKAARLVEQMEDQGLVSPANHVGKREILVPEGQ